MKRILVIEDDTEQRELFKDALEEARHEVIEAQDGEVGLRLFHQQPCDLVITDIFMPEKEGLETILVLRAQYPNVKIIAISGGDFKDHSAGSHGADIALVSARSFGADCTLHKPIRIQQLLGIIDELLNADLEEDA